MNVWNEYFLSLIFASSEKNMSVGPGLKSVLTSMQYTGDWGGLFAAVVIVFLPTLLLFVLLSKMIIGRNYQWRREGIKDRESGYGRACVTTETAFINCSYILNGMFFGGSCFIHFRFLY